MSLANYKKITQLCLRKHPILFVAIRNHWNKDYKPGPFPKTPAERAAAAKKYGLELEEYKPIPDDGAGVGDYPKLPNISADSKDPYYPWDNPELKRNFNEPIHINADLMGEDRYDVSFKHRHSNFIYFAQFIGALLGTFAIMYALERCRMFPGLVPKQYPQEGKKHYTFEPQD